MSLHMQFFVKVYKNRLKWKIWWITSIRLKLILDDDEKMLIVGVTNFTNVE